MISFSKLARLRQCASSAALPQIYSESGDAAQRGNEIHAYLCRKSQGKSQDECEKGLSKENVLFCRNLPFPLDGTPEMAMAWHEDTGNVRMLGEDIGRNYVLLDGEIAGTADLVAINVDTGTPIVSDYKTGRWDAEHPSTNLQLGALAVCVAKLAEASRVIVRIIKVLDDATFHVTEHTLDAFDLAAVETEMRQIMRRVRSAERMVRAGQIPDLTEGPECTFCNAKLHCPAKVGALVQLRNPTGLARRFDALLGEDPAEALALFEKAEEAVKTLRGQLYAFAKENPIRTKEGIFGPVPRTVEGVDAALAVPVLRSLGDSFAGDAVEVSTSKAAIERACQAHGIDKKEVMAALRSANAFSTKTTETIRLHKER